MATCEDTVAALDAAVLGHSGPLAPGQDAPFLDTTCVFDDFFNIADCDAFALRFNSMVKDFAEGGLVSSCTAATSPTTSPTTTLTTTTTPTSTDTTTPTTTFVEAALYCETFYGKEFLAIRKGVSCANHISALTGAFDDCPGDTPQLACSELLKDEGTVMVLRAVRRCCDFVCVGPPLSPFPLFLAQF